MRLPEAMDQEDLEMNCREDTPLLGRYEPRWLRILNTRLWTVRYRLGTLNMGLSTKRGLFGALNARLWTVRDRLGTLNIILSTKRGPMGPLNACLWAVRDCLGIRNASLLMNLIIVSLIIMIVTLWCNADFRKRWSTADYPPLESTTDSFRLLQIQPGSESQGIVCKLESSQFVDNPAYSALSYAWGDPKRTKSITVNGAKMQIADNLWHALHSIRHPKEPRTLWADAICIDQSSTEEKNQQVPLMPFIYSRAKEVLVWLGQHKPPRWVEQSEPSDWTGNWAVERANEYWPAARYWLYRLIQEEYWKRTWIVQEIGMASRIRVHFGRQSITWAEFIKLARLYSSKVPDNAVESILKLEDLRYSKYRHEDAYSLFSLLNAFHNSFSSVKHDKIYAFLTMAGDYLNSFIPINYAKSPFAVYQDVITAQNLSVFDPTQKQVEMVYFGGLVRQLLEREFELIPKHLKWFGYSADPNSWTYKDCGDEKIKVCEADKSGNTTATLYLLDRGTTFMNWLLSFISRPKTDYEAIWRPPVPESIEMWLRNKSEVTAEGIEVRGAVAGYVQHIGPSYSDYLASFDVESRWTAAVIQNLPNETDRKKARGQNRRLQTLLGPEADFRIRNIASFHEDINRQESPRLFLGSDIMMGLVPPNVKVGDIICQFWNSSASAVLRQRPNGDYDIVGRAGMVREGENIDWDVPIRSDIFSCSSERAVDLRMDIMVLTRLSFNSVILGRN
jgi:hypothetical protein